VTLKLCCSDILFLFLDALNNFDGGVRSVVGDNSTAGVFSTYPQAYLSTLNGFFDQVYCLHTVASGETLHAVLIHYLIFLYILYFRQM